MEIKDSGIIRRGKPPRKEDVVLEVIGTNVPSPSQRVILAHLHILSSDHGGEQAGERFGIFPVDRHDQ